MSVRSNVWSFTVNTRKSVNLPFLEKLVKYTAKQAGGYICREKPGGDKEHIHGLFIFTEIRHKDSVNKQFIRMMECIPSEDYEHKQALKLNPVYNDDWEKNYLQKAEDTIVDFDKVIKIEYCTQIVKREDSKEPPLSQKLLDVCTVEELVSYNDIRIAVIRYLRANGIPPPRMDQINGYVKSIWMYMNIDNEELINRMPIPEGYERRLNIDVMKDIKFDLKGILY